MPDLAQDVCAVFDEELGQLGVAGEAVVKIGWNTGPLLDHNSS